MPANYCHHITVQIPSFPMNMGNTRINTLIHCSQSDYYGEN